MRSVPLQRDCVRTGQDTLRNELPLLVSSSHSAALPVKPLAPWSVDKSPSLRNATDIAPRSTDKRRRARRDLLRYTVRPPTAISEPHASRIVSRSRTRPNSRASIPKPDRLLSLRRGCFAPLPTNGLVVRPSAALSLSATKE